MNEIIFDRTNPYMINDRVVIKNGRFRSNYSNVEKFRENTKFHGNRHMVKQHTNGTQTETFIPAHTVVESIVWKANNNSTRKEVFIVEYKRKLNEDNYQPRYFPEKGERNHVRFANSLLRHMERQLDIFPGNHHKKFWIETEELEAQPATEVEAAQCTFPEFHLYFEREFLGRTFDEQLETGPAIETKLKWFTEAVQGCLQLYWNFLYIQLEVDLPILIHENTAYIDMEPLIIIILDMSFKDTWLFKTFPVNLIKPVHLRQAMDNSNIWNRMLTDMLFKMFYRRKEPFAIMETELIWWRLQLQQYSLKDLAPYFSVEVFILLARVYKSRSEDDLFDILLTMKLNPSNKMVTTRYEKVESITMSGGFGDVYIVEQEISRKRYALKVIALRKLIGRGGFTRSSIEANIKDTMLLDHPNVIKYVDVWFSDRHYGWVSIKHRTINDDDTYLFSSKGGLSEDITETSFASAMENLDPFGSYGGDKNYLFILMEACDMSLNKAISKNTVVDGEKMFNFMEEMLCGIEYLNSQGYMHRDMKPDNALISKDDRLVISDFDSMITIPQEKKDFNKLKMFGSRGFLSPEMKNDSLYNEKTDYYSVGITFCKVLLGDIPIEDVTKILKEDYLPTIQLNLAHTFLLRWMTETNHQLRAGYYNIKTLIRLIKSTSLDNTHITSSKYHYIDIFINKTGTTKRCLRVAKKFRILRRLVRKYSRQEFQICRKEEIECLPKDDPDKPNETDWVIDFIDGRVSLTRIEPNYCYFVFVYKLSLPLDGPASQMKQQFISELSSPREITTEIDIIDNLPTELLNTELTLYWPPEKFISKVDSWSDKYRVFCLGVAYLRFYCTDISEDEFILAVRQLQKGEEPYLDGKVDPESRYLIYSICSVDPEKRRTFYGFHKSLSYEIEQVVEKNSYRSFEFFMNGTPYPFAAVITILNKKSVIEAFVGRLKSCRLRLGPEAIVGQWIPLSKRGLHPQKMLNINEAGSLIEVIADDNAINIVFDLRGQHFKTIWNDKVNQYYRTKDIHIFYKAVHISEDSYHGNISLDNLRHTRLFPRSSYPIDAEIAVEYILLPLPELLQRERDHYKTTGYASPEQLNSDITTYKSDIFSLGVLLYELLCLAFDIEPTDIHKFQQNEKVQLPECFVDGYESLILSMTAYNPDDRIKPYTIESKIECIESSDYYRNLSNRYKNEEQEFRIPSLPGRVIPQIKPVYLQH